ncbi:MAG: DHH family phosphoesterase, partial [Candidatus Omnitrophica bacterium]|nr:DHH family phosphoesterase [Candidatus Omnitrophota bacterium]
VSAVLIAAFFLPAGALSDQVIPPEHSPATVFLSPALVLNASSLTGCFSRSPAGDIVLPRTKNTPGKEAPAATASKRVAGGYFYSPSTGQYISRTPLKIDASIKKAAMELGIPLWWNDDGRIGKISFIDARRLFDKLGMRLMSPTQYWQILADAYASGDEAMLKELRSRAFAEWLDVIFIRENGKYFMIEHPTITPAGEWGKNTDRSRFVEIDMPKGRYAWFTFDSIKNIWKIINKKFGFPYKESVTEERGKTGTIYKFWDIYTDLVDKGVAGMRGYVTSSDTPSLDCAMPLTVQSAPLINIRPCRTELPAAPLDADLFDTLLSFMDTFDTAMNSRDYRGFYERKDDLIAFLSRQMPESARELIRSGQENVFIKTREKVTDILGFLRMYALSENEPAVAAALEAISADLFGVSASAVSDEEFSGFIVSSRERLQAALDPVRPKNIVFVMGHKNPDTDTVISSLFEAYRNQLRDPATVYIPVVQGSRIPDEVQALLRDKQLSEGIFLSDEPLYERAYASGQANWILVDQNVSEVQKFVISILDHHTPQEAALRQDAAKTIEIMGSTTAMVVQRFQGMGIDLTGELARICYGATLMDTENRSRSKMTLKDSLVMDRLAAAAGMNDRPGYPVATEFYQSLMSALLGIADADYLFERDYKDDWGFGFAVVKIKHLFDRHSGTVNNADFIRRLLDLARESNARQNLPLTLVKICDYEDDNETVFKERMYFIFGNNASEEFKRQTLLLFRTVLNNEFRDKSIAIAEQAEGDAVRFVEWDGVSRQLSRKKIAPVLQPVVQAFNRYFYSVDLGLYVSRDFLKMNNALRGAAHKLGIELSADAAGYVNYVSPYELYMLMDELGYSVLSLSDYVRVRNEAAHVHDRQMLASLESHDFVEVLGTVVLDYDPAAEQGTVVDHPRGTRTAPGKYEVRGERDRVNIPR